MVLDRNPDNFFAETEQVAFLPTNVPPGIDFSEDPLLQGRLFSYQDTQLSRLGTVNFHQMPINQAKGCPFQNLQRDGHMQMQVPKGRANYEPNSLAEAGEDGGPREDPEGRLPHRAGRPPKGPRSACAPRASPTTTARRGCSSARRPRSSRRTWPAPSCSNCPSAASSMCATRVLANLQNVDEDLATRVADGLNMELPPPSAPAAEPIDMEPSPALRIVGKYPETLKGRAVGILVTDGADGARGRRACARRPRTTAPASRSSRPRSAG